MKRGQELLTPRLKLRRWRASDRAEFAALNADAEVVQFLGAPLDSAGSDALVERFDGSFDTHGFGFWAVETKNAPFIGFVGLSVPTFDAHFTPCVEVGWRLSRNHWGNGYATEGATEALRFAFHELGLDEVVALTTVENERSRRVMKRLEMTHDPADDFEHPRLAPGHPLRRHVLYRARRVAL